MNKFQEFDSSGANNEVTLNEYSIHHIWFHSCQLLQFKATNQTHLTREFILTISSTGIGTNAAR